MSFGCTRFQAKDPFFERQTSKIPAMWVFTSRSFLSIVEHNEEPSLLHVRARFPGDIESVFPNADVIETPRADYRFRTSLSREKVAEAISRTVRGLDYENFMNSVVEADRKDAYIKVWESMWNAQDRRN